MNDMVNQIPEDIDGPEWLAIKSAVRITPLGYEPLPAYRCSSCLCEFVMDTPGWEDKYRFCPSCGKRIRTSKK